MKFSTKSLIAAVLLVVVLAAPAYAATYYLCCSAPSGQSLWSWWGLGYRPTCKVVQVPALAPAPAPAPNPGPAPAPAPQPTPGLSADEQYVLDQVNNVRAQAGLRSLKVDFRLVETARAKSQDMVDNGYSGHTSPTIGSPFDQMRRGGISYRYAGENIAGASTAQRAFEMWIQSPGHKANILNANFTHIGIGVVKGSAYGKILTQHFTGI